MAALFTIDSTFVPLIVAYFFLYIYLRFPPTNFVHPFSQNISPELNKYRYWDTSPFNSSEVLAPLVNFYENYRIAPEYNLATCQIQKSLSTLRAGIFCVLYDTPGFLEQNLSISELDWYTMSCGNKNEYFNIEAVHQQLKPNFGNFAVVRDPVDRFISGFVDKCVNEADRGFCYGCNKDLHCFTITQYNRFKAYTMGQLGEEKMGFEDIHFAPQTWYCRFNEYFSSYRFIRYENGQRIAKMSDSLQQILEENGVEEPLRKIIEKETLRRTYHTTHGSSIRQQYENELYNSPDLLQLISKMFYFDFIMFDYPFPKLHNA
ncbi:unnamed protein product [Auanema sp. JU1783]|nr:unnamed protein product [Auanema sp. JU1783]